MNTIHDHQIPQPLLFQILPYFEKKKKYTPQLPDGGCFWRRPVLQPIRPSLHPILTTQSF